MWLSRYNPLTNQVQFDSSGRLTREFRDPQKITGLIDYYLTAYESVFDFIETLSEDQLNINKKLFNKYRGTEDQDNNDEEDVVPVNRTISEEDVDPIKSLLYHNSTEPMKFENSNFNTLLAADIGDLHSEYQLIIQKYKQLSEIISKYTP